VDVDGYVSLYGVKAYANKTTRCLSPTVQPLYRSTCETAPSHLRLLFSRLSTFSNVPRKKAKFVNFAQSSLMIRDLRVLGEMFSAIEATALASKPATVAVPATHTSVIIDEHAELEVATVKSNSSVVEGSVCTGKRRRETVVEPVSSRASFNWKKAIIAVVSAEPVIKISKLRRRVLGVASGAGLSSADAATFDKKLAKLVAKRILLEDGETVSLSRAADSD
jgi:hypothetical protein